MLALTIAIAFSILAFVEVRKLETQLTAQIKEATTLYTTLEDGTKIEVSIGEIAKDSGNYIIKGVQAGYLPSLEQINSKLVPKK